MQTTMLSTSSKLLLRRTLSNSPSARTFATTLLVGGDAAVPNAVTAAKERDPNATLTLITTASAGTSIPAGISKVYTVPENTVPESFAAAVHELATNDPDIDCILGTSTKWGSTVIPRIGALVDASPVTDIVKFDDATTVIRPVYAGNALVRVQVGSSEGPTVLSIRPTAFEAAEAADSAAATPEDLTPPAFPGAAWVSASVPDAGGASRPDLSQASTVVSGGRGLNHQFEVIESLADTLGAAVGASRAAVDAGMAPNNLQVGQTGTVVAPNLYFAIGISGAIQHISGMKDSKTVVAINKDPEAPIFQMADYGLVADLFTAVPELQEKLAAAK